MVLMGFDEIDMPKDRSFIYTQTDLFGFLLEAQSFGMRISSGERQFE
jgi:hypothetical protein